MNGRRPIGLLALVAILAAGCGGGIPRTHYYLLEPSDVATASRTSSGGLTIGVEPFAVDSPYDQDRIVYRVGDASAEVGFYAYHRWAAPLSRMLPRVVAAGLDGMSGVRWAEPARPGRDYDARLGGRVLAFEEIDTDQGITTRVRLELHLELAGDEIWSGTADVSSVLSGRDASDVVASLQESLVRALTRLAPEMERAVRAGGS